MRRTLNERLDHYSTVHPVTGCWLWWGAGDGRGYGHLTVKTDDGPRQKKAYRLSWERHNGPVPKGLEVCHKCDVRLCINPDHLFVGTHKENMLDAKEKGKMNRGANNGRSKLTEIQVIDILLDSRAAQIIAQEYGIEPGYVYQLKNGSRWGHVVLPIGQLEMRF